MDPMPCDTSITRFITKPEDLPSPPKPENPFWDDLKKAMDN
jgi:hypothetical protein